MPSQRKVKSEFGSPQTVKVVDKSELNLKVVNKLNKTKIYKIDVDGDIQYVTSDYKYILVEDKHKNIAYFACLTDDDNTKNVPETVKEIKQKYKYKIYKTDKYNFVPKDLSKAKRAIEKINDKLQRINDKLYVEIDYLFRLKPPRNKIELFRNHMPSDTIVIALCYRDYGAISTISLDNFVSFETIKFDSTTAEKFTSFKFNKLLRSILFIVCPHLKHCFQREFDSVCSYAANPISAYSMITHFGAKYDNDFKGYVKKHDIKNVTFDIMEKYINKRECIECTVELGPKSKDNAKEVFKKTLKEIQTILCERKLYVPKHSR